MKNFKKLSREELKNTFGGLRSCKLVVPNGNGSYTTYSGSCDGQLQPKPVMNADGSVGIGLVYVSFCNIGDGVVHTLTSNSGYSTC